MPLPEEAKESEAFLPAATSVPTLAWGPLAETINTRGTLAISAMGSISFSISKGMRRYRNWFTTILLDSPIANVYPSRGALNVWSKPILPPAPGRFSGTNAQLTDSVKALAVKRAIPSVPPPGGAGMMSLIGLAGKVSAKTDPVANIAVAKTAADSKARRLNLE
ncbi:hypothetical protein CBM2589_U10254 [Cupriavidus taiwanensis]|uniref:Uncharacterized protein n=1 Tax=Cupriavidus taiwanensis TaxID=164546 RepID=A0A375CQP7_9BURK|nr:hypothetical protein CBM2589_U10254 [Cupriavidus taiwanensis]